MAGPLSGYRILDLTSMVSGPLAAQMLGDQGADVVKVESPSGDHARRVATRRGGFSAAYLNNNRNKRSVVLNFKDQGDLERFYRLAETADIVLQNYRPGVAERIGVGYEHIKTINPKIIYGSIAGFGFDGPLAQKPVFDPLIQAVSGLTTIQGGSDQVRPRLIRTILPDKLTGIQMSQALTAALLHRERTGEGQHVKVSMLDTVLYFIWSSDMGGHTFVGDEMAVEEAQSWIDLIYETRSGHMSVAVMQDKEWRGFLVAADREDVLSDPRFQTAEAREQYKNERLALIQDVLITNTTEYWLEILEKNQVPCAPVLTRTEIRQHPQVLANDVLVEVDHPQAGTLRQVKNPAQFSKTVCEQQRYAPALGEHTEQVFAELGDG